MQMPFGKYKGTDIEDLPSDYLEWLATELDAHDDLIKAKIVEEADEEFQYREAHGGHWFD